MDFSNEKKYIELFKTIYEQNILEVTWAMRSGKLKIERNKANKILEEFNKEMEDKLDFEAMMSKISSYVSSITILASSALEDVPKKNKEQLDNIETVFGQSLFNKIVTEAEIKMSVSNNQITGLTYEILTKRSPRDLKNVIGYNVGMNLEYTDSDKVKKTIKFEINEENLEWLIEGFSKVSNSIKSLE